MDALVAVLIALAVTALAIVVSQLVLRRAGKDLSTLSPQQRRPVLIMFAAIALLAVVIVPAFATGHAGLGAGVLVGVVVLSQLVLISLRLRRARSR
jgi:hypothetical protein